MPSRLQRPQHCEQAASFAIFDVLIQIGHTHIPAENVPNGSVRELHNNV